MKILLNPFKFVLKKLAEIGTISNNKSIYPHENV